MRHREASVRSSTKLFGARAAALGPGRSTIRVNAPTWRENVTIDRSAETVILRV